MFQHAGFDAAGYPSPGNDPVQIAIAEQPDIISMDILMPEMDGLEAAKRLKSDVRTKSIPLFFYTSQSGERETAVRIGAAGYFVKDAQPENALVDFVRRTLGEGAPAAG